MDLPNKYSVHQVAGGWIPAKNGVAMEKRPLPNKRKALNVCRVDWTQEQLKRAERLLR